jgi:cytochrome c-type biogenesis protein CcmH
MLSRRQFVGAVGASLVARRAWGQGQTQIHSQQSADGSRSTMVMPMNDDAYKPVSLPPRAGAGPSMSNDARDALEHRIHCQCGCTLDVYTCRTTDFTCPISPAMHKDVMALVAGGYSADEIIRAFQGAYGDKVLMAPPRVGFNWAGYVTPFVALGIGGAVVAMLITRWRRVGAEDEVVAPVVPVNATPDELRRLEEAIRRDDDAS